MKKLIIEWHLKKADECLLTARNCGLIHEYRGFLAEMAAAEHIRKARKLDRRVLNEI